MAMINCNHLLSFLFFFLVFSSINANSQDCSYFINVKTGSDRYAATNSTIDVILGDSSSKRVHIRNLGSWRRFSTGLPFRRDSVDAFSGHADCLDKPVCRLTLISDGSGAEPGWYVDYVQVVSDTTTYPIMFQFDQWLSINDPPYQLNATRTMEWCAS